MLAAAGPDLVMMADFTLARGFAVFAGLGAEVSADALALAGFFRAGLLATASAGWEPLGSVMLGVIGFFAIMISQCCVEPGRADYRVEKEPCNRISFVCILMKAGLNYIAPSVSLMKKWVLSLRSLSAN